MIEIVAAHVAGLEPRREAPAPGARAVPLDREAFAARLFPYGRRHDLEAIAAYGTYRAHVAHAEAEHGQR